MLKIMWQGSYRCDLVDKRVPQALLSSHELLRGRLQWGLGAAWLTATPSAPVPSPRPLLLGAAARRRTLAATRVLACSAVHRGLQNPQRTLRLYRWDRL